MVGNLGNVFWYNFAAINCINLNLNIMEHTKDSSKGRDENQSSGRRGSEKTEKQGSRTSKSDKGKGSSKK